MELHSVRLLILSYLSKYPEARDTIDGIEWWILREYVTLTAEQIRRAVDDLVQERLLIAQDRATSAGVPPRPQERLLPRKSRRIYSLNKAKLDEISWLLDSQIGRHVDH